MEPIARTALIPAAGKLFHRVWPWAVVLLALGVNVAWVALIVYWLVSMIELAF
jgi:hypothetical protein